MLHGFWYCRYGRDELVGYGREGLGARRRVPGSGIDRLGSVGLDGYGIEAGTKWGLNVAWLAVFRMPMLSIG